MKKIVSIIIISILLFCTYKMLSESDIIMSSVSYSLNIWLTNVFPSLFPFFILSELLINYGFVELVSELFKSLLSKLFKINSNGNFIFIMSMISGCPSNAKYTRELYLDGKLTADEATKILMFSHFSSPLFILGTVTYYLKSKKLAIIILISHYLSNIIIGIIFRNYYPSNNYSKFSIKKSIDAMHLRRISNKNFGSILSKALINNINTLLLILGVLTTFSIITAIIDTSLHLNIINKTLLAGFLEITQGLKYVSLLKINIKYKALLITGFLSFGGLSVHTQVISILSDTKIKYKPFLLARIIHAIVSIIICLLILTLITN